MSFVRISPFALSDNVALFGTEAEREVINTASGESTVTTARDQMGAHELVAQTSETTKEAAQRAANGAFQKQQLRGVHQTVTVVLDALLFAKPSSRWWA